MRCILFSAVLINVFLLTLHADWPQFRGPNSSGIATGAAPPVEFGPDKNKLWHVKLAAGHSSPCIVGESIYLTTYQEESKELAVVCLARDSGKQQWRYPILADKIEKGHPSFNPASSTPTCDGEFVAAYFGSTGLVCLDAQSGEIQWDIEMPIAKTYGGNAISPIIVENLVILYRGCYSEHYLLAVDKRTGQERWKVPQAERFTSDMSSTGVPIVHKNQLILHSARAVQSFDWKTGKLLWQANCATTATSTPVLAEDQVVIATWNQTGEPDLTPPVPDFATLLRENDTDNDGQISRMELPRMMIFHRNEGTDAPQNGLPLMFGFADKDKDKQITKAEWDKLKGSLDDRRKTYVEHGILAIRLDSQGTLEEDDIQRLERKGIPEVPSPLYHDGIVYFVKNGGILSCVELASGRRIARLRTKGTGTHYASPIIAGGRLYSAAGDGKISVVELGSAQSKKPKVVAVNDMRSGTYATPAVVDGVLYVRTHDGLFAFSDASDK